jgi:hypothetical protein
MLEIEWDNDRMKVETGGAHHGGYEKQIIANETDAGRNGLAFAPRIEDSTNILDVFVYGLPSVRQLLQISLSEFGPCSGRQSHSEQIWLCAISAGQVFIPGVNSSV